MSTSEQENLLLSGIFARQRAVNIKSYNHSQFFVMDIPSVQGSTVVGNDLQVMFGQMLDQIITMEALRK